MKRPYPELEHAVGRMPDKIDGFLRNNDYRGEPIEMYLAGGLAVNYYCGSRYTEDMDAFTQPISPHYTSPPHPPPSRRHA